MLAHLSSWISESRGFDKVLHNHMDPKLANATRPVVEILPGGGMGKRQRSISMETPDMAPQIAEAKRRKISSLKADATASVNISPRPELDAKQDISVDSDRIRETIDAQLSLEILLKHNELRLINQELAKCQVALEQLRRCHLVPYPTANGSFDSMVDITNGTGPAMSHTGNVPQWAPSYGVADGPYTRHYSKWLIPDPKFDGIQPEWHVEGSRAGKTVAEGRSTRYSIVEGMPITTKSRSMNSSQISKHQALPSGYPQEKTKNGPCVLKRADGQTVKLVCVDCNRFNFASIQGFINHCRIAHRREFKSHEEAAVVSGQPYEADEAASGPVEVPVAPPTPLPVAPTGLVHPLIRSTPGDAEAYRNLLNRIDNGRALFKQGKLPGVSSIPTSAQTSPIKSNIIPSTETPQLSNWLRSKNFAGDLSQMVGEAKTKVDLDDISSQDGDSESESQIPSTSRLGLNDPETPLPVMRMPARATMSPGPHRPGSSKAAAGFKGMSPRLAHVTPVINTSPQQSRSARVFNEIRAEDSETSSGGDLDLEMLDHHSMTELSPHTITSNNAPSLVSDDGEYEDGDDAESTTSDDEDSVAEIDIEDDGLDKVVPRTALRNRAGSGSGEKDKHVTFMSPVKEEGKERRRK